MAHDDVRTSNTVACVGHVPTIVFDLVSLCVSLRGQMALVRITVNSGDGAVGLGPSK